MNTNERLLKSLTALYDKGQLPKSQCSNSLLDMLRPLITTSVIVEQRSGSGRTLAVKDRLVLKAFIRQSFPNDESPQGLPQRVIGVHRFRDSKTFASDNPLIVEVRAWQPDILRKNGECVRADNETSIHSVFAFQMETSYTLQGRCALVEGPAVFSFFERLELGVGLAIYYHGRASDQLLKWLAGQIHSEFSILHLPDYDPAGLNEFERVRKALGRRTELFIPDDLDQMFARYSNRSLLRKRNSQALLANLRRSDSGNVRTVVQLIDRYNAGLEHEALLSLSK